MSLLKFLFWIFGHAEKRLDKKAQVNFKIYDTANLITNNFSRHITRYHKIFKYEIRSVNRTEHEKYCFSEKTCTKCGEETSPRLFLKKIKIEHIISGSTAWSFIPFVFIVCQSRGLPKHVEAKVLTSYFLTYRVFFGKWEHNVKLTVYKN